MNFSALTPKIAVKDVTETIKFYSEVLGFKVIGSMPEGNNLVWAVVRYDDVVFIFQEEKSFKEDFPCMKMCDAGGACLAFYVRIKNMKEYYEKIKGSKHIVFDLKKTDYGTEEFAVMDNNGYVLNITEEN